MQNDFASQHSHCRATAAVLRKTKCLPDFLLFFKSLTNKSYLNDPSPQSRSIKCLGFTSTRILDTFLIYNFILKKLLNVFFFSFLKTYFIRTLSVSEVCTVLFNVSLGTQI